MSLLWCTGTNNLILRQQKINRWEKALIQNKNIRQKTAIKALSVQIPQGLLNEDVSTTGSRQYVILEHTSSE